MENIQSQMQSFDLSFKTEDQFLKSAYFVSKRYDFAKAQKLGRGDALTISSVSTNKGAIIALPKI